MKKQQLFVFIYMAVIACISIAAVFYARSHPYTDETIRPAASHLTEE
jgi:hypothetical protein